MSERETDTHDGAGRDTFFQKAMVLGASGYASELVVDPSPLNELLDQGWSFLSATPTRVDVSGGGTTAVVHGAVSLLVIVEWRRLDSPEQSSSASDPTPTESVDVR